MSTRLVVACIVLIVGTRQAFAACPNWPIAPPTHPTALDALWTDPQDVTACDLRVGSAGRDLVPHAQTTFRRVVGRGDLFVHDDQGRLWEVSRGAGARADVAASRILWAAGYHVRPSFWFTTLRVGNEQWQSVRIRLHDDGRLRMEQWEWRSNPFVGTTELQGLKTLLALLNVYDFSDDRNEVYLYDGRGSRVYTVASLGRSLGRAGRWFDRSAAIATSYASSPFIVGQRNGVVRFAMRAVNHEVLDVSVGDAQRAGALVSRLSDRQMRDAFEAAGFIDADVDLYVTTIRKRLEALRNLQ